MTVLDGAAVPMAVASIVPDAEPLAGESQFEIAMLRAMVEDEGKDPRAAVARFGSAW